MSAFVEAAGWTLVHFLWQGAVVAAVLAALLRVLKTASSRYMAAAVSMVLLFGLAVGTFLTKADFSISPVPEFVEHEVTTPEEEPVFLPVPERESEGGVAIGGGAPEKSAAEVPVSREAPELIAEVRGAFYWQLWVVAGWLCGVGFFGLRFFLDWRAMRSLRKTGEPVAENSKLGERFVVLLERAGISRPVRIMTSVAIRVPVVFGTLRPVVIVPVAMLAGLTPSQVDAILLHELAHVRRHDFLVNLLQSLFETVFFFHPGVWWISKRMREERELCCDDVATDACGGVEEYAHALTALEISRRTGESGLGMAADGGKNGKLLGRIRRLVRGDDAAGGTQMGWAMAAVSGVAFTGALIALAGLSSLVAADGEKEIGIENMTTSHFGEPGREIFCIHTEDAIQTVVVILPPKEWKAMGMKGGVRQIEEGKDGRMAWAKYHWDETELEIAFDSREPGKIRLNDQGLMLRFGKVIFWRDGEKWADQSTVLAADLPEVKGKKDDDLTRLLGEVRARIIEEFAPKDEKVIVPTNAGKWELGDGVSFELKEELVHAADVETTGIIRWPASEKWPASRYEFNVGADQESNRDRWALGMKKGGRVLWLATEGNFLRIDFSDPEAIERRWMNSAFGDMPDGVRAEFQKQFVLGKKLDRIGLPYIGGNVGGHEEVTASTEEEFVIWGKVYDALELADFSGDGLHEWFIPTDKMSAPFAGVHVQAISEWAPMKPLAVGRADARGKFELRFRASLEMLNAYRGVKVKPVLAGYFDNALNARGEFYMALSEGEKVEEMGKRTELVLGDPGVTEFQMVPAARVSGVVVDGKGKPIPKAYVGMLVDEKDEGRGGYVAESTHTDSDGRFLLTRVPKGRSMQLVTWNNSEGEAKSAAIDFGEKRWERLVVKWDDGEVFVTVPGDEGPEVPTVVRVVRKQVEVEGPEDPLKFARVMVGWLHTAGENLTEKLVDEQTWNRAVAWSSLVHVRHGTDAPLHEPLVVPLIGESPVSEILFHLGRSKNRRLFVKTKDGAVHVLGKLNETLEVGILEEVGETEAAKELEEKLAEEEAAYREGKLWEKEAELKENEKADEGEGEPVKNSAGPSAVTVHGRVVDIETGRVIRQAVVVQGGLFNPEKPDEGIGWGYSERRGGERDGTFSTVLNLPDLWRERVLVDGYLPKQILDEAPDSDANSIKLTLWLVRGREISGRVLDHRGEPLAGASVFAVGPTRLNVHGGKAWDSQGGEDTHPTPVVTGADGRFAGLRIGESGQIAVSSAEFDAWPAFIEAGEDEVEVRLPEPAGILIDYDIPGAPEEAEMYIHLLSPFLRNQPGGKWAKLQSERTSPIARGRTEFKAIPPGSYTMMRRAGADSNVRMEQEYFVLKPGEIRKVDWTREGGGVRVKAKVSWPEGAEVRSVDYIVANKEPNKDLGGLDVPNVLDGGSIDLKTGELFSSMIPPGEYTMGVGYREPMPEERGQYRGYLVDLPAVSRSVKFTVPKGASGALDLGEIVLEKE